MNFDEMTLGQMVTAIVSIGVVCGFLFKVFNVFNQVKNNTASIKDAHKRIDKMHEDSEKREQIILNKLEETNKAVNLLCSAISAIIDHEITNGSLDELKRIKKQLDDKKEIV